MDNNKRRIRNNNGYITIILLIASIEKGIDA